MKLLTEKQVRDMEGMEIVNKNGRAVFGDVRQMLALWETCLALFGELESCMAHAGDFAADCDRLQKENEQLKAKLKKIKQDVDTIGRMNEELISGLLRIEMMEGK